jgi:Tfp pilus assembly protein PilE
MAICSNPFRAGRSKGITLVEVAIGLTISALVLAVSYSAAQSGFRRNEITANADSIVEIVTAARAAYGQRGLFNQLNTQLALQSGLFPHQYLRTTQVGNDAVNSYGAPIALEAFDVSNSFAYLRFEGVPADQCMPLVMAVSDIMQGIAVTRIGVTAKPGSNAEWNVKQHADHSVLDISALEAACTLYSQSNLHFSFTRGSV